MNEIHLLATEYGKVLVSMNERKSFNGEIFYEGRIFDLDHIQIIEDSEEECLKKLKKAFETYLNFKLKLDLSDLNLTFSK